MNTFWTTRNMFNRNNNIFLNEDSVFFNLSAPLQSHNCTLVLLSYKKAWSHSGEIPSPAMRFFSFSNILHEWWSVDYWTTFFFTIISDSSYRLFSQFICFVVVELHWFFNIALRKFCCWSLHCTNDGRIHFQEIFC